LPIPTRVTWFSLNSLTNSGLFATDICVKCRDVRGQQAKHGRC
jgi:hypothetical protein